jgi:hypothetical protein
MKGSFRMRAALGPPTVGRRLVAAAVTAALALAMLPPAASFAADPPANDSAATATVVPGLPFEASVDTSSATDELGEPNACGGSRSVWYAFTATWSGTLTVDAAMSTFGDPRLAAYRSSSLTPIFCGVGTQVTFGVMTGVTYFIQATDSGSGGGVLRLSFARYNNDFAAARSIPALPFAVSVVTRPATFQAADGERDPCGYGQTHTVWYAYTATTAGTVTADTIGSTEPDPRVVAYRQGGTGLSGLSAGLCGSSPTAVTFPVSAGTQYYVQASDTGTGSGMLRLAFSFTPAPDKTPPVISDVPDEIDLPTFDPDGRVVTFSDPNAFDAVSGRVAVTCAPASGSMFPVGTTHVECSAADAAGNRSVRGFDVVIVWLDPAISGTFRDVDNLAATAATDYAPCLMRSYPIAQTFTAGRSGNLVYAQVALFFYEIGVHPSSPITMEVRRTDSTGGPFGPVLATTTIPASAVTSVAPAPGSVVTGAFADPAFLIAGSRYAIKLTTTDPFCYAISTDQAGSYSAGASWGGWEPGWMSPTWNQSWRDLLFATYIGDPDTTSPAITYSAHPAVYTVADLVHIGCTMSDAMGISTSSCADVDGYGWTFGLGPHLVTASATDVVGNVGSGSTAFAVVATYSSVEDLTRQWVTKAGVGKDLVSILESADAAEARGQYRAEAGKLADYRALILTQIGKAISVTDADLLMTFSKAL